MKFQCSKLWLYVMAVIGILLTIISTLALIYFPNILSNKIKEKLPLVQGSESLERFKRVKVPISMSITFFEVQNPEEVALGQAKAVLKERGPYVFDETRYKEITHLSKARIGYKQFKTYIFNSNKSIGPLNDEVLVPNVPAIVMSTLIAKKTEGNPMRSIILPILEKMISSDGQKLFMTRTVREVLFEGYQVSFLHNLKQELEKYNIPLKLDDKFGFFLNKNDSHDGEYLVDNGFYDAQQFTRIEKWEGKDKVHYWGKNSDCNRINGTDGSQFHPNIQRTDRLYIFSPELCRSIYLEYQGDSEIRGISTFRFGIPKKLALSPLKTPENECFCVNKGDPYCSYDGLMDASPCKKGAPIVLTSPHFFGADRRLLKAVVGLNPQEKVHETYINIEPNTGLVFDAAQRLQINLVFRAVPEIRLLRDIDDFVLPVLWLQESASIDAISANQFKSQVTNRIIMVNSVFVTTIFVGILLIFFSLALVVLKHFDLPNSQVYAHPIPAMKE